MGLLTLREEFSIRFLNKSLDFRIVNAFAHVWEIERRDEVSPILLHKITHLELLLDDLVSLLPVHILAKSLREIITERLAVESSDVELFDSLFLL